MGVVEVRNLIKKFTGVEELVIFDRANLIIEEGDLIGLVAPSGYGKSTLIYIIAGLLNFESGNVIILGKELKNLSSRGKTLLRRKHIGVVYQFFNLLPTLTALENVMLPMELLGVSSDEAETRALELLKLVGLHYRKDHFPYQLSGGEQQRVAFARALANNPSIILADEPTGNLDERNADILFKIIRDLNRKRGATILVASHDISRSKKYLDKLYTIRDKKIIPFEG